MWICIRCRAQATTDEAAPNIDDVGLHFMCPTCGRRNALRDAGRDEDGLLLLEQVDRPERGRSCPRAAKRSSPVHIVTRGFAMPWICTNWNIDWQAVGSIVGAFGLVIAALAAYFAAAAARATLQVDQQQAGRADAARTLRAASVAPMFWQEVSVASDLARRLIEAAAAFRAAAIMQQNPGAGLDELIEETKHLRMPQLERFADRFVDFDLVTAETLVRCVGIYAKISVRPPGVEAQPPPTMVREAYISILGTMRIFADTTSSAAQLLLPYVERAVAAQRERNARVQADADAANARAE